MRRNVVLLLSSAAAIACLSGAQAAPVARPATLSASSYSDLLEPVANAKAVLAEDEVALSTQPKPLLHLVQFHHHHHHHHHSGFFPGAVIGGVLGGLAAGPTYYGYGDDYGYDEPDYASPPVVVERGYGPSVAWCEQHYRSYDPSTETYLGYDGMRHSCP